MANIRRRKNGTVEIRFIDHRENRVSLYAGQIAIRDAEAIAAKIAHIISRKVQGSDPDVVVSQWLAALPDKLHSKLVKLDLAAPRQQPAPEQPQDEPEPVPTVKQWTDQYIAKHPGKERTLSNLQQSAGNLCTFFGDDRTIDSFTAGDAEDFRKWLQTNKNKREKKPLAENTVRCRIRRAKQFFKSTIQHELIAKNPFENEKSVVGGNDSRLFMVPAEWVERCVRKSPCEDWRIILAFARYAGMRAHECTMQRWEDIDLANNRMVIRSNKTPPIRTCPIFPELRPHLLRAWEMAPTGAVYVQTRYTPESNLRTTLEKIITKAGLVPWPRLMQNLRATRETELLAHYPAKDVTSWLGNSPQVANKHYAMVMQESFNRAIQDGAGISGVTCGVSSKVPQKVPHTSQDNGGNSETGKTGHKKTQQIAGFVWQSL